MKKIIQRQEDDGEVGARGRAFDEGREEVDVVRRDLLNN